MKAVILLVMAGNLMGTVGECIESNYHIYLFR